MNSTTELFERALNVAFQHEGLYSNNPRDPGGETWRGIARVPNPSWRGWEIVDRLKASVDAGSYAEIVGALDRDPELAGAVHEFYLRGPWGKLRCDEIASATHPTLAALVFDCAINPGPGWAPRALQDVVNLFNRGGELFPDIHKDGIVGPATLSALEQLRDDWRIVGMYLLSQRVDYYRQVMTRDQRKEDFTRGWGNRCLWWAWQLSDDAGGV